MFTIEFEDSQRTISRKANAIKVAERDGALRVLDAKGVVVWESEEDVLGAVEEPKAPKTEGAKRSYNLTGAVAKADADWAAEIVSANESNEEVELVDAEEIVEGDEIADRRTRTGTSVVGEVKIGRKWVTIYDEAGKVAFYAPLGTSVPRLV